MLVKLKLSCSCIEDRGYLPPDTKCATISDRGIKLPSTGNSYIKSASMKAFVEVKSSPGLRSLEFCSLLVRRRSPGAKHTAGRRMGAVSGSREYFGHQTEPGVFVQPVCPGKGSSEEL